MPVAPPQGMPLFKLRSSQLGLVIVTLLAAPAASLADWVPVLSGSIERVVASEAHVAVVRDGKVILLRENGDPVAHRVGTNDVSAGHSSPVKQEVARILDSFEIPEIDRGTDAIDEFVDDERSLAGRRLTRTRPTTVEASGGGLIAASASRIWIRDAQGLARVDRQGSFVRVPRALQPLFLAAGGDNLLLADAHTLVLLSDNQHNSQSFTLTAVPEHLALSNDGERWAWSSSREVHWTRQPTRLETLTTDKGIRDLVFCGDSLVVLLDEGVVAVASDGTAVTRNDRLRAVRLLCPGGAGVPWLAVDGALLVSVDQGRTWLPQPTPAGAHVCDVAVSNRRVWLATREGLFASGNAGASNAPVQRIDRQARRARARRTSGWSSWLPTITLRAGARMSSGKQEVEAFALAAFPLDTQVVSPTAVGGGSEPAPVQVQTVAASMDTLDPHAACLEEARRRAVEIAMTEPARARSYVTRAGRAAWLPELRVVVSRRYGRSESLDISASSTALSSPLGIDTVNDIRYEARATWDLARLVFSPEELAAQTQALHMAELRRDIETTVNRLYFERREIELSSVGDARGTLKRHLRASEIDADLDAMSGGTFLACIAGALSGER
jgi:hypothetical protein